MSQASVNPQPGSLFARAKPKSATLRNIQERSILAVIIACGLFSLVTTVLIVFVLARETVRFFQLPDVSVIEFFTGLQWNPLLGDEHHYGIWPLIAGTMLITGVAMIVALPLGLITAIWLAEYAPPSLRAVLKPVLEIIAGIPTVVLGFFALTVITPALQSVYRDLGVYNALSAGIAVGILTLPIVTSLTEDALRAVPRGLREGSYGLGATKLETSLRVVVPAALSGIIAAFLLAVARAVGETMVVALAAGSMPIPLYQDPSAALNPLNPAQPMTGYMVQIFLGDVSNFGPEYYSSYAVAAMLFAMTLLLTVIGHQVRVRFQQVYE